jgi:hypothetical protein
MMKGCFTLERQWADRIERTRGSFSRETMDRCDKLARTSTGGSYQMLGGCLVMDLSDRFFQGKIDIIPHK